MVRSKSKYYIKNRDKIIDKVQERQRKLKEQGRCIICGAEVDTGYIRCPKHLKQVRELNRKHDSKKYREGLCKGCSKPLNELPIGTLRYCGDCAIKQNEANKVYIQKEIEYENQVTNDWKELNFGKES